MTSRLVASSVAFVSFHMRELRPVGSDVCYLVRDDQMVLGVDGDLHVVTHDTGASSTRCHRARIRPMARQSATKPGADLADGWGLSSLIQYSTHRGNSVPCPRSPTHRAGTVT